LRKITLILVAVAAATVAATALEAADDNPPAAGDETLPAPDLAGYRLCPECNTLNRPEAEFCARCGADLNAPKVSSQTALITREAVLKPMGRVGNYEILGVGLGALIEIAPFSYQPTYAYAFIVRTEWEEKPVRHYLDNRLLYYFQREPLRPLVALDVQSWYEHTPPTAQEPEKHYFVIFPGAGAGVEVNYGRRGSSFDLTGTAGPAASWHGGPAPGREFFALISLSFGNVHYFGRRLGFHARGTMTFAVADGEGILINGEFGPAIAF